MDIIQLEYFNHVASTGNMSESAKHFYLTPQTISKQIKALEHEIGFELFQKTNRGVTLTEEGTKFLFTTQKVCGMMRDAVDEGRRCAAKGKTSLSIGIYRNANIYFMPKVVKEFRRANPEVELSFVDLPDFSKFDEALRERRVLVTMTAGNADAHKPGISYIPIAFERAQMTVEADDPLAGKAEATARDLRGRIFSTSIAGFSKWNDDLRDYLARNEPTVEIFETNSNETGIALLRRPGVIGIGVPTITPPEWIDRTSIPFRAPEGIPSMMSIDIATSRPDDPLVRSFVRAAKHVYQQNEGKA